ncbi:MAG TPA: hypothetical protein VFP46_01500 [Candidatus Paceibacterota bacterium]|nr:hypothetical protein [Candidatus Paceibacterota bacterium]
MRSDLERILTAANQAPSGENCQPWHFVVRGSTVEVHLLADRDRSAYSWGERASYLAIGAAIENLVIAASAEHYRAPVRYFPDPENRFHTATVTLVSEPSLAIDPLVPAIAERATNRKPYDKKPLSKADASALAGAAKEADLVLVAEREKIERLGRVGSTNEEIMLANHGLHRFFFDHVNWTKEEDEEKKIGFYIKTLELPPPARAMFRVMQHWPIMRALATLGMNRVVAVQNGATNASAAAIGAVLIDSIEPVDFIRAGRTVERVWLTATARGLSVQPLTGVLFFKLMIDGGDGAKIFSAAERSLVQKAYEEAAELVDARGKHIAFMFRVGKGDAPSARAIRFPLEQAVTVV